MNSLGYVILLFSYKNATYVPLVHMHSHGYITHSIGENMAMGIVVLSLNRTCNITSFSY